MRAYNRAETRAEAQAEARIPPDSGTPSNADLVAQYLAGMRHASRHLEG